MKLKFYDMAEIFISQEKDRVMNDIERYTRTTLVGFAEVMDARKGAKWNISDVSEADGRAYYESLTKSREIDRGKRLKVLSRFMTIALNEGWINKLPWKRLYEHKKGGEGHFRISEKERERLISYLKEMNPVNFWDLRDRAMLLLLLTYRLRKTEVSTLDLIDYDGRSITVRTSMQWRNREIEIDKSMKQIIDSYLLKREELKEALNEKALFIGFKRNRISAGMVNLILKELTKRRVNK